MDFFYSIEFLRFFSSVLFKFAGEKKNDGKRVKLSFGTKIVE